MTCPNCGKEVQTPEPIAGQEGISLTTRCPSCDHELSPGQLEAPPRSSPLANGCLFVVVLIGSPAAWFALALLLVGQMSGGNAMLALVVGVLLYGVATVIAFRHGPRPLAIGALVGAAIPLLVFGACLTLLRF